MNLSIETPGENKKDIFCFLDVFFFDIRVLMYIVQYTYSTFQICNILSVKNLNEAQGLSYLSLQKQNMGVLGGGLLDWPVMRSGITNLYISGNCVPCFWAKKPSQKKAKPKLQSKHGSFGFQVYTVCTSEALLTGPINLRISDIFGA